MITEQHSSARSCTAFQTSMDDFQPSTRITGNNARGNKRRIGHSKRSSVDPVDDGPKKKRKDVEDRGPTVDSEAMPSLPGANSFFHNQRVGSKGIKGKIQDAVENGELLQITQAQFDAFLELAATQDPDRPFIEQMRKQHVKILPNLTWLLLTDRNLLLYGIGSKQRLLRELVHSFLTGEDVIEINAPLGNNALAPPPVGEQQVIKALLSHIERTVLKNKNVEACGLSLENRAQVVAGNNMTNIF